MDLLIVSLVSLLLVPVALFATGPLRIALGLPFVLFFPGYTLIAALFPRKSDLDGIERLALSFGLSIAVVPLIGLALNYTPWGIRLYPILISLLLFIIIMAAIALYRRQRLPAQERFEPQLRPHFISLFRSWSPQGRWDKALTVLLLVAIVGAIGTLAYVIAKPKVGERFSEFYILGPGGKPENYPREVILGRDTSIILGIANHEHQTVIYEVEIAIDGQKVGGIGPVTLNHDEKWEQQTSFAPRRAGLNQKIDFLLYKGELLLYKGESREAYRSLHLWLDVKG